MSDMHALRPELPSQRLRQGAQRELAGREGGAEGGAFHGGGGAGEDEGRGVRHGRGGVGGEEEEGQDMVGEEEGAFAEGRGRGSQFPGATFVREARCGEERGGTYPLAS